MDRSQGRQARATTILIADDDAALLKFVAHVLEQNEFAVVTASDGAQALRRAHDHGDAIDLLLTDYDMPHMNGLQLAAAVRELLPHVVVVLMSGSPNKEAAMEGTGKFLKKPFSPPMLVNTINGLLQS